MILKIFSVSIVLIFATQVYADEKQEIAYMQGFEDAKKMIYSELKEQAIGVCGDLQTDISDYGALDYYNVEIEKECDNIIFALIQNAQDEIKLKQDEKFKEFMNIYSD